VLNRSQRVIDIDISELSEYFGQTRDSAFVERIRTNAVRYQDLFSEVIDKLLPPPSVLINED